MSGAALSREEELLVDGCRRGDEKAWLTLYRAYGPDIAVYLRSMSCRGGEVEDLVQRVFLEFLGSLSRFRGESGLRTWLHRIARHVALGEIRSASRRAEHLRAYAEVVDSSPPDAQVRLEARSRLSVVQSLLGEVEPSFREAWILRELAGFSAAEAAEVLEVAEGTVRTRHHRARRHLFALLEALEQRDAQRLSDARPYPRLVGDVEGGA